MEAVDNGRRCRRKRHRRGKPLPGVGVLYLDAIHGGLALQLTRKDFADKGAVLLS